MRSLALALALVVTGCAGNLYSGGLTASQSMAIACRGYAATISILAPYRHAMSVEEVASVAAARAVISPLCRAAATGEIDDYAAGLIAVRNKLRIMLVLERKML